MRRGTPRGGVRRQPGALAACIPPDLASDSRLLARMPLLLWTARGKMGREEIIRLAERLKSL